MPGAPTPPEDGTHWRNMAESALSRYHFFSSAACHPQLRVKERPGRLLLTAWSPLANSVSVGMWRGPGQAYQAQRFQAFPGTVHIPWSPPGLPTSPLPSPSLTHHIPPTYLWAQSLLWGLVCLEVPCSPASLRGPVFQLIQEYQEALGKTTSLVSDTESPRNGVHKRWGCSRSQTGSLLLKMLPSLSTLPRSCSLP